MDRPLRTDEFERMMNVVSEQRRARVRKFTKPDDAARGLLGDVLARAVIGEQFQVSNDEIVFAANRCGKPFVVGLPSCHFNISHSGRWIVCALDGEPVGIDVEQIKPIDFDIAKCFFSSAEYRYVTDQEEHQRLPCLYDVWTVKESFAKWTGQGLSLPPHCYSIHIDEGRDTLTWASPFPGCFCKQWNVDADHKMAACSTSGVFPEQMTLKSYDELIMAIEWRG